MTLVSMLCTPSCTNCDCHYSITGENASSWAWQEFGIFATVDPAPQARRRRYFSPIPDGTCQLKKRLHEDDNGVSISQPKPAKMTKESQKNNNNNIDNTFLLPRSGSSTVSLSEEENKASDRSIVGQRDGGSPRALRGGGQSIQGSQANNMSIGQQISSFLIEEAIPIRLEEECICPHPLTNDVLSRIASTPFDSDRMKSCYKQNKESINTTTGSDMTTPLPIIPQNKFIQWQSNRKLAATIDRDVSTFLLNEAAKIPLEELEKAPPQKAPPTQNNSIATNTNAHALLPVQNGTNNRTEPPGQNGPLNTNYPIQYSTNNNANKYDVSLTDVSVANFGVMHDDSVAFLGYKGGVEAANQRMQPGDVIVAINGASTTGLPGNYVVQQMLESGATTVYRHLTLADRNWYNAENAPKTVTEAQKNYDDALKLSMSLRQRLLSFNKSYSSKTHSVRKRLEAMRHHFTVAEKLRSMAFWKLRSKQAEIQKELVESLKAAEAKREAEAIKVLEAKKAAKAKKKKVIPTATASDVIKISRADVSKLPVAFGFRLGDKSSKIAATAAATKWRVEGKKASNSIFIGKNTPSSKGTPESGHSAAKSTTPRSSAILISTESMSSNYPGWTKKTYERASGNTAGTKDTYFYSPQQQIKFRAMKGVDTFMLILAEPDVAGDESKAMVLYKQRGYKK